MRLSVYTLFHYVSVTSKAKNPLLVLKMEKFWFNLRYKN